MVYLSFKAEQAGHKRNKSNKVQHNSILTCFLFHEIFDSDDRKKQTKKVIKDHDNFSYHFLPFKVIHQSLLTKKFPNQ
jgi:hypothetical protein